MRHDASEYKICLSILGFLTPSTNPSLLPFQIIPQAILLVQRTSGNGKF